MAMNVSLLEKLGLGALLCAWLIYGANFLGNLMVSIDRTPVAAVHGEAEPTALAEAEPEPPADLGTLLAAADPGAGEKVFGKCKACHSIEAGGSHGVGPNLYDIVGATKAAKDGFSYSGVLAEMGDRWDYAALDAFLENPRGYATGTKMSFAGLKKADQRADVIAYLREYTESPPPLPEPVTMPEAEPAAAEAAGEAETAATETAATETAATDTGSAEPAAAGDSGLAAHFAAVDAAAGEKVFRKCKACHTVEEGGRHQVGPNLYNVVGAPVAAKEEYNYSSALANIEGEWTYEKLSAYLAAPREFAPGNKMSFVGLKKPEDRAAVILYLREHTASPPPLPQ